MFGSLIKKTNVMHITYLQHVTLLAREWGFFCGFFYNIITFLLLHNMT